MSKESTSESDLPNKNVISTSIVEQMEQSYLAYSMSVIVGRALPDVRDGLKPVHRRILHAMNERAWRHDKAYVKSAKIVGEVIGNFHPHGDTAVYDTMVRMAQPFALRELLIDGQGNFGSVDGDPPAAYRYTEARLTKMAESLLEDIDKETVNFTPNFDDTRKEPVVLPAAWPNLLVNGSSGIAVGMATKIPPHNLQEVLQATLYLIKNPECTIQDLMKFVQAPDFPTGGIIFGREGLKKAYTTGKGSIKLRAVYDIEEIGSKGQRAIIITEIPYEVKKNELLLKIAGLVNDKKIIGISGIRDESDRNGMRIVLLLKKDTYDQVILNQLFKSTSLETSYGITFLAIVSKKPMVLNLKQMLEYYLVHRKEVVTRRFEFDLRKAKERAHILEGLKVALDFIDEVIKIIRKSTNVDIARTSLIERFSLTKAQADAILEMRLQKLTSLESTKLLEELDKLNKKISEIGVILGSESKLSNVISSELEVIQKNFKGKRRTQVNLQEQGSSDLSIEDLITDTEQVVVLSSAGYIRRVPADSFRRQTRGGKGVTILGSKDDRIQLVHQCSNLSYLIFFSNRGKVFFLRTYELPEVTKDAKGKHIRILLALAENEEITVIRSSLDFDENKFLVLLTLKGIMKKMQLYQIRNAKKGGMLGISFKDLTEERLIDFVILEKNQDIFLATAHGQAVRTNLKKTKAQGRSASGIIGMTLVNNDVMIGLDESTSSDDLLVVTDFGYGKRIKSIDFNVKGRGGKGMTYFKTSKRTGAVAKVRKVLPDSEIMIITSSGMIIRLSAVDISLQGRTAGGVRLVETSENDRVIDVTVINQIVDR